MKKIDAVGIYVIITLLILMSVGTAIAVTDETSITASITDSTSIIVTTSPEDAKGGTFDITYKPLTGTTLTEIGTTPKTFSAKKKRDFTITNIQSSVKGYSYIGPVTVRSKTGDSGSIIVITLQYAAQPPPPVSELSTSILTITGIIGLYGLVMLRRRKLKN